MCSPWRLESFTGLPEGLSEFSSGPVQGIGPKVLWYLATKGSKSTSKTPWNYPNTKAAGNVSSKFAGSKFMLCEVREDLHRPRAVQGIQQGVPSFTGGTGKSQAGILGVSNWPHPFQQGSLRR